MADPRSTSPSELAELAAEFEVLGDWEERYRYVIDLGRDLAAADRRRALRRQQGARLRQPGLAGHRAAGRTGRCSFRGDSDAHIVRGLIAILLRLYSGRDPDEILAFDAKAAFEALGLDGRALGAALQRPGLDGRAHPPRRRVRSSAWSAQAARMPLPPVRLGRGRPPRRSPGSCRRPGRWRPAAGAATGSTGARRRARRGCARPTPGPPLVDHLVEFVAPVVGRGGVVDVVQSACR